MNKQSVILTSLGAGLGAACGRLIIDLVIKPQPTREVILFAALAFGVGFLIVFSMFMIRANIRLRK